MRRDGKTEFEGVEKNNGENEKVWGWKQKKCNKVAEVRVGRECSKAGARIWGPASTPLGFQMEESQFVLKYSCVV